MNTPSLSTQSVESPSGGADPLLQRLVNLLSTDPATSETGSEPDDTDARADAYERESTAVHAALVSAMPNSPGSVRGAELALARLAAGFVSSGEEYDALSRLVLTRLPPEHPHWGTWAALVGPRIIEAVRGESPDDESSKRYIALLRSAHPDPLVRFVAELSEEMARVASTTVISDDHGDDDGDVTALEARARAGLPGSSAALLVCLEDLRLLRQDRAQRRRFRPGALAPDFRLSLLGGDEVTLAHYAGSLLLVQFTGTWCGPCRRLLPSVLAAHHRFGDGVRFLSVAVEDDEPTLRSYREEHAITWDTTTASFTSEIAQDYLLNGVPFLVLLGPDGRVVEADQDMLDTETLESTLARAVVSASVTAEAQPPSAGPPTGQPGVRPRSVVVTDIASKRDGDDLALEIHVAVSRGWSLYAPSSGNGLPLLLTAAPGTELRECAVPEGNHGKLTGRFTIHATVRGAAPDWRLHLRVQPCSGDQCLAPEILLLKGTA